MQRDDMEIQIDRWRLLPRHELLYHIVFWAGLLACEGLQRLSVREETRSMLLVSSLTPFHSSFVLRIDKFGNVGCAYTSFQVVTRIGGITGNGIPSAIDEARAICELRYNVMELIRVPRS